MVWRKKLEFAGGWGIPCWAPVSQGIIEAGRDLRGHQAPPPTYSRVCSSLLPEHPIGLEVS